MPATCCQPTSQRCRGNIMILATFVLLSVSILCLSYWKLIRIGSDSATARLKETQAYFAARSGIEDAISELRQGHEWVSGNADLSNQWVYENNQTFYKSTRAPIPLTNFDYPCTYSVKIVGDPSTGTVNITSTGQVGHSAQSGNVLIYEKVMEGKLILSMNNDMHFIELKEN